MPRFLFLLAVHSDEQTGVGEAIEENLDSLLGPFQGNAPETAGEGAPRILILVILEQELHHLVQLEMSNPSETAHSR